MIQIACNPGPLISHVMDDRRMPLCNLQFSRRHGFVGLSKMCELPVRKIPVIGKEVVAGHQGMNLPFQRTIDHILVAGKKFSTLALPEPQKLLLDFLLTPLFQVY